MGEKIGSYSISPKKSRKESLKREGLFFPSTREFSFLVLKAYKERNTAKTRRIIKI